MLSEIDLVAAQAAWSAPVPRRIRRQAKKTARRISLKPKYSKTKKHTTMTTVKGCSTCQAGEEQYQAFHYRGKSFVQYDYLTRSGELFSTVGLTLKMCREKRNTWLLSMN